MPRRLLPVLALLAALVPAAPAAAKSFYTPPKKLPGHKHGDLIRSKKIHGQPALGSAAWTKLVLYRSTGTNGKPIAVSGLVSVPKGKAPKGGWPVISYAHGTTGIADQCAPSHDSKSTGVHALNSYVYPLLNRYLKAGYAVVRTDYQGLGTPGTHDYLIGREEGRAVLDMARAARHLDSKLSRRLLIVGHSQGGQAALYAASLAHSWTPELKLKGTDAFAPVSHLDTQAGFVRSIHTPSGLTGLVAMIARGIDTASPGLHVKSLLSDGALALYPQTLKDCLNDLESTSSYGGMAPADFFRSGADVSGLLTALGKQEDPEKLKIRGPILVQQGESDTTVFPFTTDALVKDYQDRGNKVTYKTYLNTTHGQVVTAGAADSLQFLKAHR